MIGGLKGERALRASAVRVDVRLAQSCIERQSLEEETEEASLETKVEVYTERRGRKVSARWRRPKLMTSNRYKV